MQEMGKKGIKLERNRNKEKNGFVAWAGPDMQPLMVECG